MAHATHRVYSFEIVDSYTLRVGFEDGASREIDFRPILEGGLYGSRRWIDLLVNEREAISRAFPVPKMQAPDLSIGRCTFRTIHPLVSRAYFRRTSFFVSAKLCCAPVAVIRQKYVPPASLFASNR